jgi:hypothetical protein
MTVADHYLPGRRSVTVNLAGHLSDSVALFRRSEDGIIDSRTRRDKRWPET